MQKQIKNLIPAVLGCFLVLTSISGCSSTSNAQPVEVKTVQIDKPKPIVPKADQLVLRPLTWTIITPQNATSKFADLKNSNPSFIALTANGYQNYQMNIADLMSLLQQYNQIIKIYEKQ